MLRTRHFCAGERRFCMRCRLQTSLLWLSEEAAKESQDLIVGSARILVWTLPVASTSSLVALSVRVSTKIHRSHVATHFNATERVWFFLDAVVRQCAAISQAAHWLR